MDQIDYRRRFDRTLILNSGRIRPDWLTMAEQRGWLSSPIPCPEAQSKVALMEHTIAPGQNAAASDARSESALSACAKGNVRPVRGDVVKKVELRIRHR
jgi:hypothetical protein